ncbi:NHL repeat-containing protein [Arenibacterium sp. CAU 1754]
MRWAILILTMVLGGPVWAQAPFATFDKASEAMLSDPHDLAFGPDGQLYIADKFGSRIVIMDPDTLEVTGVIADGRLPGVHDISFGPDGKAYVAVTGASAVAILAPDPQGYVLEGALQPFPRTEGVLAHSNGRTYIMSSGTGELVMMQGSDLLGVTSGMPGAHDVAEAPDGSIWVADNMQLRLVRFSPELEQLQVIQGVGFGFAGPRYMDVDDAGRLIVADQDAHRILLIDPLENRLVGALGDGMPGKGPYKFDDPEGVAVRGNAYYISDSDNNRIVKYVVILN